MSEGPKRKPDSWEFELPPGCQENDFTGCSHDALLEMVEKYDGDILKRAIVAQIKKHGATNNQRALLQNACEQVADEEEWARQKIAEMPPLDLDRLLAYMKAHPIPQEWYDEEIDHEDLFGDGGRGVSG